MSSKDAPTDAFVRAMPKVELHLHIEGTLEPETMLALAERNRITLPWADVDALRAAYAFVDLQSFLDVYYAGASALQRAEDFHDLAWAWCERAAADNVQHAEIFFDPQTHTDRGIALDVVVEGFAAALGRARSELGLTAALIPCFLRHLSGEAAMATYLDCRRFGGHFVAFGLESSERDRPPRLFEEVFMRLRADGFRAVAHAGEEGPPAYITEALDVLKVDRIDHGVRCLEDPALVRRLARDRIPLTVCPLSNVRLRVFDRIEDHNLAALLEAGLVTTVNSDDPAYFGGYMSDNFLAVTRGLGLEHDALRRLGEHGIAASFADADRRAELTAALQAHFAALDPVAR
jgi:adenine deaminase